MTAATHTFRAMWPVLDPTVPVQDLIAQATDDLPNVLSRTRARVTGRGAWSMAPSSKVAGSGRVTENVLLFEAPAKPVVRRSFYRIEVPA